MKYDLSQPISQRGIGEKDAENQRIAEIADELRRRCQVYEAESGAGQEHVSRFEAEQRSAESYAKEKEKNNEGRFANGTYEVWDLVPRNVLKDKDGDIYVVGAEIKKCTANAQRNRPAV